MPNHGIEKEIQGIKKIIDALIEKKTFLEESLVTAYNTAQQFSLRKEIADIQKQITEKREEIEKLSNTLTPQHETEVDKEAKTEKGVILDEPQVICNTTGITYDNGYALFIGIAYKHWVGKRPLYGAPKDIDALNAHFPTLKKRRIKPKISQS